MIYLDNNASTFVDPRLKSFFEEVFFNLEKPSGNPSSMHTAGRSAKALLDSALQQVANFFDVHPDNVIFTSGATESINTLIQGLPQGGIISSVIEHSCVIESLKKKRDEVTWLAPILGECMISIKQVEEAITENTTALVFSSVNGETGAKLDYQGMADLALKRNLNFIVDATAQIGKEPFNFYPGISAICFSGHKMHAPTGIGAIVTAPAFRLNPLLHGGGQQKGRRSGTENVWGAIALGKIFSLISSEILDIEKKMKGLRGLLETLLCKYVKDIVVHCCETSRVCNVSNISFQYVDGETLLMALDLEGIMVGHGSACSSGFSGRSHVLRGLGCSKEIIDSSVRFSLSRFTTEEEIVQSVEIIVKTVARLRALGGYGV